MRHANLSEGLRAACGAGTMLLLGQLLHNPLFSWAAIGAFLTCLADSAGSNRARLASMGGFALVSTLAGMFAATLSGDGHIAGLLAIMSCAGIAGFSRLYGAATGLVLMLAAGVSAILADFPVVLWPLQQSHVLIYFAGCAWATLLGLTVWRIHPFAPARAALARVYEALAELAQCLRLHPNDSESLARGVLSLIEHPELRAEAAVRGEEVVRPLRWQALGRRFIDEIYAPLARA